MAGRDKRLDLALNPDDLSAESVAGRQDATLRCQRPRTRDENIDETFCTALPAGTGRKI